MEPNPQGLRFRTHELFAGVTGLMVQTFSQAAESSRGNKIRMGIALGTLAMNIVIAGWVTGEENKWKTFIFNLTKTVPVYLAYSMLMPEWFTWVGFPIICISLAIVEFHEELQGKLTVRYKKCVGAIKYLRDKLPKCQVPTNIDV